MKIKCALKSILRGVDVFKIEPYTLMVEYLKSKESALKLQGDYIQVVSTKECRNAIENLLKEIEVLRSDLKDCQEKAKSYDMLISDIKLCQLPIP